MATQSNDDPFAAYQKPLAGGAVTDGGDDPFAAYQKPLWAAPDEAELKKKGVMVLGMNSAGQSIYGPRPPETPGSLRTLWRATKMRTQPGRYFSSPGGAGWAADQALTSVHNVGARAVQGLESMVRHPPDSIVGMYALGKDLVYDEPNELMGGPKANGPIEQRIEEFKKVYAVDPRRAIEDAAGDVLGMYMSGKLIEGVGKGVTRDIPQISAKVGGVIPAGVKPYLPPVGRVVGAMKNAITDATPKSLINHLIRPAAADLKFGKNPAQAILDEGITGNNLHELGDKVNAKLQEVGQEIDQRARNATNRAQNPRQLPQNVNPIVDVTSSLNPINDAIAEAVRAGDTGLFKRLNNLKMELTWEWRRVTTPKGKVTLEPYRMRNLRMSPEEALKFKRMVGDKVRWTGLDPFENTVNEAAIKTYGGIKDQVNAKVSGLKELNERYANLVGAMKAIERRIPVEQRNAAWSLSDITLGATGHLPIAVARKIAGMPAVTTRVAGGLYRAGRPPYGPTAAAWGRVPARAGAVGAVAGRKEENEAAPPPVAAPAETAPPAPAYRASPFAHAVSGVEGFGTAGTVPMRANNPGNLKNGDVGHGVIPATDGGKGITIYGSPREGWDALDNQLNLIFSGKSDYYTPDMSLSEFGEIYSNGDAGYGARLAKALNVDPSTTLGEMKRFMKPPAQAAATRASTAPSGPGYPTPAVPGNIQWYNRPQVDTGSIKKGTTGTVLSASREEDGMEVLFPLIYDGKLHSEDEAWQYYKDTGEHMGKFSGDENKRVADADAYGQKYHEDAEAGKFQSLPLPQAKAQVKALKPSAVRRQYAHVYGDPASGHQIGSDDGQHWFDLATGAEVK